MTSILWFMISNVVKQVKFCDNVKMVRGDVPVIFFFYQLPYWSLLLSTFSIFLLAYKEKKVKWSPYLQTMDHKMIRIVKYFFQKNSSVSVVLKRRPYFQGRYTNFVFFMLSPFKLIPYFFFCLLFKARVLSHVSH